MIYDYDKDEIKNSLSIEQVNELVAELGGEPQLQNNLIIAKTICHGGDSHKLYYYDNTKLFTCYTGCVERTFDIFQLVLKVKGKDLVSNSQELVDYELDTILPRAIEYVARYFGFSPIDKADDFNMLTTLADWKKFESYDRINQINQETQRVELKTYEDTILTNLPRPIIKPWINEGITQEVMTKRNICYDPKNCGIVIPHYDIDNRLIGIRERTLIKENEVYGKYRPALLNKQLYNHPLSFNLYNLNNSKDNIANIKKAIVWEGEKSPMLYASYFGEENDISVACCGSSFIQYQAWLLISLGVEEIIIAFDKQFKEIGDDEYKKLVTNLKGIHKKYGHFVKISFLFDKWDYIGYKDSPIDRGPDVFMELFKRRVQLY